VMGAYTRRDTGIAADLDRDHYVVFAAVCECERCDAWLAAPRPGCRQQSNERPRPWPSSRPLLAQKALIIGSLRSCQ